MAKSEEERKADFVRLAEARTENCLFRIRQIRNLASGQYAKTPEQVATIFGAIETELAAARAAFDGSKGSASKFTL